MTKEGRSPTLVDVAKRSGVSKSTVSSVVRGAEHLSDRTKEKVLAAIEELGYRPNGPARDLRLQRPAVIGVVVNELHDLHNAELLEWVEACCARSGYAIMVCSTGAGAAGEPEHIDLLHQRVAGLLVLEPRDRETGGAGTNKLDSVPAVLVGALSDDLDSLSQDHAAGAELAARHLVDLGHRRLAYLPASDRSQHVSAEHIRGIRTVVDGASGCSFEAIEGSVGSGSGEVDLLQRMVGEADSPTAIVVGSDAAALGLQDAADRLGLQVPGDLSVVGFDDVTTSALRRISLTTVGYPKQALIAEAVALLVERVEGSGAETLRVRTSFVPELAVRGSTGPA